MLDITEFPGVKRQAYRDCQVEFSDVILKLSRNEKCTDLICAHVERSVSKTYNMSEIFANY